MLTLAAALICALGLDGLRGELGPPAAMPPAEAGLVAAAQWALWLLAAYAVAVVTVAAALVALRRPGPIARVTPLVPAALRPLLGALLGVALTAVPAAAASPLPPPAGAAPVTSADPFDWLAPADAISQIDTAAVQRSGVPRRAPPRPQLPPTVRVGVGDCLWSLAARDLAARHLGSRPADITVAWRRWYAANRATIGPDPGLLRPGEVLRVPAPTGPTNPSNRDTGRRP
jgi:hypothetical protein